MTVNRLIRWSVPAACLLAMAFAAEKVNASPLLSQPGLAQAVAPTVAGWWHHRYRGWGGYHGWGGYYYGRPSIYYGGCCDSGYTSAYYTPGYYRPYVSSYSYVSPYYTTGYYGGYAYRPYVYGSYGYRPFVYSAPVYTARYPAYYAAPVYGSYSYYSYPSYSSYVSYSPYGACCGYW